MLDSFLTAEEKVELKKIWRKREKIGLIYFFSTIIIGLIYFLNCFENILLTTILLVLIVVILTRWYLKEKAKIDKERREFLENVEANGEDSVYKKIERLGKVYKGEVVHAKRNVQVHYYDEYIEETVLYDFVIKFNEDGKEKYLVQRNFIGDVELINESQDEIDDVYQDNTLDLEKFKDENCINVYQYTDGIIYSFEKARENMELDVYSDSILKNYVGQYFFPIYKYENLYRIGNIEGYKKKEEVKEEVDKQSTQENKNNNSKIGRIETILIIIIFMILCSILEGR